MVRDPVCGMEVYEKTAKHKTGYKNETYYFCSNICKMEFDKNPRKYVKVGHREQGVHEGHSAGCGGCGMGVGRPTWYVWLGLWILILILWLSKR